MRLIGKKLYRTGPLKLFKGYGNPGESTYQSTTQSAPSRHRGGGGSSVYSGRPERTVVKYIKSPAQLKQEKEEAI